MGLPDELIIQVLDFLDAASLKRLACTCKALYAFSRFEDLWKTLCIEYELLSSHYFLAPPYSNLHLELRHRDLHCLGHCLVFLVTAENMYIRSSLNAALTHSLRAIDLHMSN